MTSLKVKSVSRVKTKDLEAKIRLTALKRSIRHWERILEGIDTHWYGSSCALCSEYASISMEDAELCLKCPVFLRTRKRNCGGSPYTKFIDHRIDAHSCDNVTVRKCCKPFIQAEIDFLKSLLPKTEIKNGKNKSRS